MYPRVEGDTRVSELVEDDGEFLARTARGCKDKFGRAFVKQRHNVQKVRVAHVRRNKQILLLERRNRFSRVRRLIAENWRRQRRGNRAVQRLGHGRAKQQRLPRRGQRLPLQAPLQVSMLIFDF